MERLNIAFCDDDPYFRSAMKSEAVKEFSRHGVTVEAAEAASAEELLAVMGHMSFQLVFLDIDLPGMDGIRLGERLRFHGFQADIIYVTNMDERVYDAFPVHPWSFIRKSRFSQELPGVTAQYVQDCLQQEKPLVLQNTAGELRAFGGSDIIYVEAAGKLQKLFIPQEPEPFLVRCALHELEQQLLPLGFIRIHKGFLVNYRYIRKITSRTVALDTGEALPVGRDRLKPARESYLSLMKWRGVTHLAEN